MSEPAVELTRLAATACDMQRLGAAIGESLQPSMTIGLSGPLGAGKTTLIQGIARGLGVMDDVTSPTFTLAVPHSGRLQMLHVDAYRIGSLPEVDDLALDDWIEDGGVVLVEWCERIAPALPPMELRVEISIQSDDQRSVRLAAHDSSGVSVLNELRRRLG